MTVLGCVAPRAGQALSLPETTGECGAAWANWLDVRDRAGVASPWGAQDDAVPVLRGTRVLAASHPADANARAEWLTQALAAGMVALEAEWANLPDAFRTQLPRGLPAHLEGCARRWAGTVVMDASAFAATHAALRPADNYNTWAGVLGAYPLAVPFMRLGVARWRRTAVDALNAPWAPAQPIHYAPDSLPPGFAHGLRRSAQILPELELPTDADLDTLLQRHAPRISVDTGSSADRIGTVRVDRDGGPWVDVSRASVYVQLGSSYLQGAARLQLIYTIWFPERVAGAWLDPYAGKFDGLVWRVTLDSTGQALAYDSIHPCGCFHLLFPAFDAAIAPADGRERPVIVALPGGPAAMPMTIGVRRGDHQLVQVARQPLAKHEPRAVQRMDWRPAAELLSMQGPDGQHHGLYRPDGLVPGSARAERFYLWPSGVPSAGAMRVWGQHATAFVGRAHFDDPRLLESWLKPVIEP